MRDDDTPPPRTDLPFGAPPPIQESIKNTELQQRQDDLQARLKEKKEKLEKKLKERQSRFQIKQRQEQKQQIERSTPPPVAPVTTSTRETLSHATSLQGTCTTMCPREELDRRIAESDIQLLETPHAAIFPSSWSLEQTVIKRFRRSAADYKLDVPEWVRPPAVLESTVAYIEEWIMERDRQGTDARFQESNAVAVNTPPALDVYQFVWDRTRMIRKDFTLQNYVGGRKAECNAAAIRCHERIARWHALCEHQLSHLDEYVTMQSQQNIQELGQTMKTLNVLYDDPLGRAVMERPDGNGGETMSREELQAYAFGCTSTTVQGPDPVDYDGTPLRNNDTDIVVRIHPDTAAYTTCEAEFRGLYILLTIDIDGGMEVLKYASGLYKSKPDIYRSKQVQLALAVYKVKEACHFEHGPHAFDQGT